MNNKPTFVDRIKNPYFLAAAAGFAYQVMSKYGVAPDMGTWQLGVDLVSYAAIGVGIYNTFTPNK
ncbi:hypothetical protein [Brevibacillus fulvus]|uniref:Uncharacterized protein n=1 Tax=Brevibacillus fulvus TaxID=1125967 RepID=A0A939BQ37_9BACL|nr:hypothetical protein [Brevibacillus fulvus]MBM7591195.1 hypothetical protein [Brevibacillus fulvus]